MSLFSVAYYLLLIAASCLAAYFKQRAAFMVLFLLTLTSGLVGLLGGEKWLWNITIAIALLLFFITGPCEELYWRGYLQDNLMKRFGPWQGWVLATAVYAGVHIWSFNFMLIGAAAVAGAFWGAMYWRLKNLAPVIISHSVWSMVIFAVFPMS